MKNYRFLAILILVVVALGAFKKYGHRLQAPFDVMYTPNNPAAVAGDFWAYVLNLTEENAASLTTTPESFKEIIQGYNPDDAYELHSVTQQDGTYFVKTTITVIRDKVYKISLFTVVTSIQGDYKVDVEATKKSVQDSLLDDVLSYYKEQLVDVEKVIKGVGLNAMTREEFATVGKHNIKSQMCEISSELTRIISGTPDVLFKECLELEK